MALQVIIKEDANSVAVLIWIHHDQNKIGVSKFTLLDSIILHQHLIINNFCGHTNLN